MMETFLPLLVIVAVAVYIAWKVRAAKQQGDEKLPKGNRVENPDIYDPYDDRRNRR